MMILTPDEIQAVHVRQRARAATRRKGQHLMFGHGFNIHYGLIKPRADMDVSLLRAEGPRPHACATSTSKARGLPGLIAIHQDASGIAHGCGALLLDGHRRRPRRRHRDVASAKNARPTCSASRPCSAAAWSS